jgi:hypothetical protein
MLGSRTKIDMSTKYENGGGHAILQFSPGLQKVPRVSQYCTPDPDFFLGTQAEDRRLDRKFSQTRTKGAQANSRAYLNRAARLLEFNKSV